MSYPVSQLYVPGITGSLTAAQYNAEIQNILTNVGKPQNIDDYSSNLAQFQVQTDPGEVGSESQATSLSEEIERLRFAIKDVKQFVDNSVNYWYESPTTFTLSLLETITVQNPANSDVATFFADIDLFTGTILTLKTKEEDSGSFNFIKCISDTNGSPINQFVVDQGGNVTAGNVTADDVLFSASSVKQSLVPIGSIIPFYDFNAALTFDNTYWAYCDGSSATVGGIGSQTLPDLSGRYLVGFGTDGGGNNDSATWDTAAVGNASHQISLLHSHTVNSHSHTVDSHTHSIATHNHGLTPGSAWAQLDYIGTGDFAWNRVSAFNSYVVDFRINADLGATPSSTQGDGVGVDGVTDTGGTTVTGGTSPGTSASSPGTDSQLSATQSIQPRSIRVRYIMRIK